MTRPKHLRVPPLRELMRRLRKHAPLCAPVRLVQQKNVWCNGELVLGIACTRIASGKPLSFRIVIDSRLSAGERWDVIVHEWAHCLDWGTRFVELKNCHDARWGQHYSRAWRASVER